MEPFTLDQLAELNVRLTCLTTRNLRIALNQARALRTEVVQAYQAELENWSRSYCQVSL
jgi:hypothetical protein